MKKKLLMQTCAVICLITVLGFFGTILVNYFTLRKVSAENIENVARLTSSNVYAEIDNDLTKPIYVAQTMANDTFLADWIMNEPAHTDDMDYQKRLVAYLAALREKYSYDSVFMISAKSNIYYHFEGINKVISPNNAHDVWYYNFLNSGQSHTLNIDTDEAAKNELTVFVDCRIESADGTLLGVVGVGVKMYHLQALLEQYEDEFQLKAFLINPEGVVQVHTESDKIKKMNLFDSSAITPYQNEILDSKTESRIFWYPQNQLDYCLTTRYIDNLGWYLIVEKDTQQLAQAFTTILWNDILIALLILLLILLLCMQMVRRYDRRMTQMAVTDELTGLPNRKWFGETLQQHRINFQLNGGYLFIMDIDQFKSINDIKGHMFGDQVLRQMADLLSEVFGSVGVVARWGGDEFIGVLGCTQADVDERWKLLLGKLAALGGQLDGEIRVSFGLVVYQPDADFDRLLEQADVALYQAKTFPGSSLMYYTKQ